jgi:hypothetical protein
MTLNPTKYNSLFEWATRKEIKEGMAQRSRYVIQRKMVAQDKQEYRYKIYAQTK